MTYTIRTIPPPEYITVPGLNGPETRPAPDGWTKPQSYVQLIYTEGSTQLWQDVNGEATWPEIKATINIVGHLVNQVRLKAGIEIEKKWPLWAQNNCALGIYGSATIDQCKTDIAAVITVSNTAEDAIMNAVSMDAALAVTPVWPVI
jgi:hypothetical protein